MATFHFMAQIFVLGWLGKTVATNRLKHVIAQHRHIYFLQKSLGRFQISRVIACVCVCVCVFLFHTVILGSNVSQVASMAPSYHPTCWNRKECVRFFGPRLDTVHITSTCFPLARTQSHGLNYLQGKLGNVVSLCAQEEEMNFCKQQAVPATAPLSETHHP